MDQNDIQITDFYNDVDKPFIKDIYKNDIFKNILELSSINKIPLLKKDKNHWQLKDKRKILKDIQTKKKNKVKELKDNLSKIDFMQFKDLKENNNKLLSDIESIDLLKTNIENDDIYLKLKNLSALSNSVIKNNHSKNNKYSKKGGAYLNKNEPIKLIDIEETQEININQLISSDSEDFIEIFSN